MLTPVHSAPLKRGRGKPKQDPAQSRGSVTPGKRGRGRPRKYPLPTQQQAKPAAQGAVPRRNIQQKDDSATSKEATPHRTRQEPNIFSSPVSSSPPPAEGVQEDSKDVTLGAVNRPPHQAPPRARRQIVQLNDDISAIVRQMSG